MEFSNDYTQYTRQKLIDALEQIDREKNMDHYKDVVRELRRRGPRTEPHSKKVRVRPGENGSPIPKEWFFAHRQAGLALGMLVYGIYMWVSAGRIVGNTASFHHSNEILICDALGLAIPLLSAVFGHQITTRFPIGILKSSSATTYLNALLGLVCYFDFLIFYVISTAGSC